MTLFLPLEADAPLPTYPSFLLKPPDPKAQVTQVIKSILKARRIVVICAGISVKAGIPDFRSPEGLFQSLRRENPKEALTSGKDLFDASVFNSEQTTALFCQMISRLSHLSKEAEPTPFHRSLKALDDSGKLLRVYTQNIDAIESKCGLTFGVPKLESKRPRLRPKEKVSVSNGVDEAAPDPTLTEPEPPGSTSSSIPRCIPLHGTLQTLHCQVCTHSFLLEDYISSLASGVPPDCPECTSMENMRRIVGKRARGVGRLRPSVVLYNEAHKDGEGVGEAVRRDLVGSSKGKGRSGADLLLVVGTSLRVPGTKRMVREFAKAVHARGKGSKEAGSSSTSTSSAPSPSPGKDDGDVQHPLKAIYLNLDFPMPTREWEGVFDAWLQGDAQTFAEMLQEEIRKESAAKELANEKKKKKEEGHSSFAAGVTSAAGSNTGKNSKKRKVESSSCLPLAKRKNTEFAVVVPPLQFPPTPPSSSQKAKKIASPPAQHPEDFNSPQPYQDQPARLTLRIPARPSVTTDSYLSSPPSTPPRIPRRTVIVPEVCLPSSPEKFSSGRPPPISPLLHYQEELSMHTGSCGRERSNERRLSTSSLSSLSSVSTMYTRESSVCSTASSSKADERHYSDVTVPEDDSSSSRESTDWDMEPEQTDFDYYDPTVYYGDLQRYHSRLETSCIRTTQCGDGG
uniref:Deacetylase sirtuin-type domain-containing protein n=1 Tax=Moniliophthora roreri TaxID=221103 RepID=A0A0W0EXL9_MONRR